MSFAADELRKLPADLFAITGILDTAYLKPVTMSGLTYWEVYRANGTWFATYPDLDLAIALCRAHGVEPVHLC